MLEQQGRWLLGEIRDDYELRTTISLGTLAGCPCHARSGAKERAMARDKVHIVEEGRPLRRSGENIDDSRSAP